MPASRFGTGGRRYSMHRARPGYGGITQADILRVLGLDLTGKAGYTLKVNATEDGIELVL